MVRASWFCVMQASEEPFRQVRSEELRRLDMCERGLAAAYRRAAERSPAEEAVVLHELASGCERSSDELRARALELAGRLDPGVDDSWLVANDLAAAEHQALATYHDHIGDHDAETIALIRDQILPRHRAAIEYLLRDSPVARDSEL
jgi:hypothetical protein